MVKLGCGSGSGFCKRSVSDPGFMEKVGSKSGLNTKIQKSFKIKPFYFIFIDQCYNRVLICKLLTCYRKKVNFIFADPGRFFEGRIQIRIWLFLTVISGFDFYSKVGSATLDTCLNDLCSFDWTERRKKARQEAHTWINYKIKP